MGSMVYKFRPLTNEADLDRLRQTISEHVLYMGPAADLNDAIEGRVILTGSPGVVEYFYDAIEALRRDACVLSFSETLAEPLMWAHYARGFSGVALEFDRSLCDWMTELYPVAYCDSPTIIDVGTRVDAVDFSDGRLIDAVLLSKSAAWSYERELRYSQALSDRKGPGDFILARFSPAALRTVVIGCRVPLYERERLVELVNQHLPHAALRFASPAGRSTYEVAIQESLPPPTAQERFRRDLRAAAKLGFNGVMLGP